MRSTSFPSDAVLITVTQYLVMVLWRCQMIKSKVDIYGIWNCLYMISPEVEKIVTKYSGCDIKHFNAAFTGISYL